MGVGGLREEKEEEKDGHGRKMQTREKLDRESVSHV